MGCVSNVSLSPEQLAELQQELEQGQEKYATFANIVCKSTFDTDFLYEEELNTRKDN